MEKRVIVPKLRFPEFEGNWELNKLSNISDFLDGRRKPIKESERSKIKGEYPYYGASGIIDYVNDFIFDEDIILLGEDGENIVSRSLPLAFRVSGKCWVNNHAHVIKPKSNTDIDFLTHSLERISFVEFNTGTAQPKLNQEVCRGIKLFFPMLPEQTKIARFLTLLDGKLNQLKKKKILLEQYKKGVMQQLFSQELRFKDEDGNDFPKWIEMKLGTICKIYDGTHQTPDYLEVGIPFYSVEHVTSNNFTKTKFISKDVFEKENQKVKLEKGDILMTKIGDIGTARYIDWDVNASFYVSLALIKQSSNHNNQFICHYIHSTDFQSELHNRTIHVAFPKKINLGEIGECLIKLPCIEEQLKIASFLSALDDKIAQTALQIEKMQLWKKGLLQQMFV